MGAQFLNSSNEMSNQFDTLTHYYLALKAVGDANATAPTFLNWAMILWNSSRGVLVRDQALVRNGCFVLETTNHSDPANANVTWTTCANHWLKSSRATMLLIEVLVRVANLSMVFLSAFGSSRRRSRNFFTQKVVLAVYVLSPSLLAYTLGSMQSAVVKSSQYYLWASFLPLLIDSADSITAYSLDDNTQLMRRAYETSICIFHAGFIAVTILQDGVSIYLHFCYALAALMQLVERSSAHRIASASWDLNKVVADYMYEEHNLSGSSYDPVSMEGYHYLVDWRHNRNPRLKAGTLTAGTSYAIELRAREDDVIDIEKIWQCNDRSLSQELKDTCLSFSLFHLLRRRYFGFECAESSQPKTHDFVFRGLLARNEDGIIDYSRVFEVIEVELAFMYDFFFTKRAAAFYRGVHHRELNLPPGFGVLTAIAIALALGGVGATWRETYPYPYPIRHELKVAPLTTTDAGISLALLVSVPYIFWAHNFLYRTSIWHRVAMACRCVRNLNTRGHCCRRFNEINYSIFISMSNCFAGFKKKMSNCFAKKNKGHYWQNKLGQYSLLESVPYKPNLYRTRCLELIEWCIFGLLYLDPPLVNQRIQEFGRRNVNKPGKPIELPAEVKKALVQSLERTQGTLTNGQSSLESNRAHHLLWACRHPDSVTMKKENQTPFILTWHIATCYCEMATLKYLSPRPGGELKLNLDVATKLSKYCAYLVVSAPKLLPGHHYDTKRVFDAVAYEACDFLHNKQDKYDAMRLLPESRETPESKEPIFRKGVRLGKQLEEMEVGARWKVLADFWSEMLLYVAPSDNLKEHFERLANGGEFLTHLWALLSHAGILDREQRIVNDIENAGADQSSPGQESYGDALQFRRARAALATCATNQPARSGNNVELLEISIEGGRTVTSGQGSGNHLKRSISI